MTKNDARWMNQWHNEKVKWRFRCKKEEKGTQEGSNNSGLGKRTCQKDTFLVRQLWLDEGAIWWRKMGWVQENLTAQYLKVYWDVSIRTSLHLGAGQLSLSMRIFSVKVTEYHMVLNKTRFLLNYLRTSVMHNWPGIASRIRNLHRHAPNKVKMS